MRVRVCVCTCAFDAWEAALGTHMPMEARQGAGARTALAGMPLRPRQGEARGLAAAGRAPELWAVLPTKASSGRFEGLKG
jgi:hypothetical protein